MSSGKRSIPLRGRWDYLATKQSKFVTIVILAVFAAAVIWILVLQIARSM